MLIDLKFTFLSLCKTTESTFLVGSIKEQYCFILHCGCFYQEFPFHKWGMGASHWPAEQGKAMTLPSTRVQTCSQRCLSIYSAEDNKETSHLPFLKVAEHSRVGNLQIEILLLQLTLKWEWGGVDPHSTLSGCPGALLAPVCPRLATRSHLLLIYWLRS